MFVLLVFVPLFPFAQKKPLDHTVYDSWQNIGERAVSNDGQWVVYSVLPQEGDGELIIKSMKNDDWKMIIPRGNHAVVSEDSKYVVFKISPKFADTREAKIKKKKPDEMPKDSLCIIALSDFKIRKFPDVKSFKTPEEGSGWVAFQLGSAKKENPKEIHASKKVDSLKQTIDSLNVIIENLRKIKKEKKDDDYSFTLAPDDEKEVKGSDVILLNLSDDKEVRFSNAGLYEFDRKGTRLVLSLLKDPEDSNSSASVVLYSLDRNKTDTLLKGGNDFKSFTFSEDGKELAFVAERDTAKKPLQKSYDLYLFKNGEDSAKNVLP